MADGRDQFTVQRVESSFCRVVSSESRLVGVEGMNWKRSNRLARQGQFAQLT